LPRIIAIPPTTRKVNMPLILLDPMSRHGLRDSLLIRRRASPELRVADGE